jgi:hypothetical protein
MIVDEYLIEREDEKIPIQKLVNNRLVVEYMGVIRETIHYPC